MADKKECCDVDETLTIPAGYFIFRVDFDADPPYCRICPSDSYRYEDEKDLVIPKALAYYLSTHDCGSKRMRELIEGHAARDERNEICELFEKLMDKLGFKLDFDKLMKFAKEEDID